MTGQPLQEPVLIFLLTLQLFEFFIYAKKTAAVTLDIKSDNIRIVAAKLKVVEEADPPPTVSAQLTNTEDELVNHANAIDLKSNAKPKNLSVIIDGWNSWLNLLHHDASFYPICSTIGAVELRCCWSSFLCSFRLSFSIPIVQSTILLIQRNSVDC